MKSFTNILAESKLSVGKTKSGKDIPNLHTKEMGKKTQSGKHHLKTPKGLKDKSTRAFNVASAGHYFGAYNKDDHKDAYEAHDAKADELEKQGMKGSPEHQNHIANMILHQDLVDDMATEAKKTPKYKKKGLVGAGGAWKTAKRQAKKQGQGDNDAYAGAIFKKMQHK